MPRKSAKVLRKKSKSVRKSVRKSPVRKSKKSVRKSVRKSPKKSVRKSVKKSVRKMKKSVPKTIIDNNKMAEKYKMYTKMEDDIINALGKAAYPLFFDNETSKRDSIVRIIKKILHMKSSELRQKHFNRETKAPKLSDPENDKYKVVPTKRYFKEENVEKAFEIYNSYEKENHPSHLSDYNPFLEMSYDSIYDNMFENMFDKENMSEKEDGELD